VVLRAAAVFLEMRQHDVVIAAAQNMVNNGLARWTVPKKKVELI